MMSSKMYKFTHKDKTPWNEPLRFRGGPNKHYIKVIKKTHKKNNKQYFNKHIKPRQSTV